MNIRKMKTRKGVYILSVLSMLIISVIFLNSFYWPYQELSKRKIFVGVVAFFLIVVMPILSVQIDSFYGSIKKFLINVKELIKRVGKNKKKVVSVAGIVLFGSCFAIIATYIVSRYVLQTAFNIRLLYAIIAMEVLVLFIILLWKNAAKSPEKIFAVVVLTLGIFCISVTPGRVGVSWDDEVHYAGTLEISNLLNGIMYSADERNIVDYGKNIYARSGYDRETDSAYTEKLETSYAAKEYGRHDFSNYGVWSVAYIPSAIGIMFGRGLGLSYAGVFNMGRAFNLFMYAWLIYMSIKRVKYGKVLIAAIGLLPTTVFMASSYSYDPWVIGFTILGFSYFFAELQEEDLLKNKNILIMVGALTLGCMPKATYFPLLFPLLFLPKRKFKNSKQRKYYYLSIVGAGIFLVATFMLPMLISGPGTGDVRGGADVNATEQVNFILKNPLAYARTLLKFDLKYISLGNLGPALQSFAYAGDGHFFGSVSLIFAVLAFLDRGENEKNHVTVKATGLIGCIAAIVLSTTALYISFTAVGARTVAGMQARYIFPIIYPALYAIGLGGVSHKINKNAFVCVPMLIIAFTFICNVCRLCVIYY